uniref:Uncharacterized protein n=1 Tax=Timema monikensis TaxID=170555 RepID=A0A7R9HJ51_9NEOP|nr:unnamed protein product [Timema monikensis]
MVASCSAYNCQERYVKGGDITFHSFPKNEELKRKWVLLTRRQNFIPTQASKLCSKHFTSDCFDNDSQCQSTTIRKKTKLKQDAVPSIFNFPRFVNTLRNKRKHLQRQASPPVEQKKGKDDWKSSQLPQTCPQHLTASNFILCPDRNVKRPTTEHVSAVFNFPALLSDRTTQQDPSKEIPSPPDKVKVSRACYNCNCDMFSSTLSPFDQGGSQLEVCRLCMGRQNKMTNLYGGEDATNSDLISRIMKCASIEVFKDDGLPPQVCERCLEKVNASYDFRLQCESSDSILRQQLVQLSTTVLPNEIDVMGYDPLSLEEVKDTNGNLEFCEPPFHSIMIKNEPVYLEEGKDTSEASKGSESPLHKKYFKEEELDPTDDNVDNGYSPTYRNDNVDIDYSPSVSYNDDMDNDYNLSLSSNDNMDANYDPNDEQETLKCGEFGERFTGGGEIRNHSAIHTGKRPGKSDARRGKCITLSSTLAKTSSVERLMKCEICGGCFKNRSSLLSHQLIHSGVKPHKCDECGKFFIRRSQLTRHFLMHTGKRTVKCDECGRRFTMKYNLKAHAQIHSELKRHKCDECGKYFNHKRSLTKHSLKHQT